MKKYINMYIIFSLIFIIQTIILKYVVNTISVYSLLTQRILLTRIVHLGL